ncbi:MAG: hypothetical protein Q9214_001457 [Letrouitia sp. 1 TL-2023]
MGQSVSALVESIENNAQKEKLANDALNSLVELAVRNPTFNAQLIPIDKILDKDTIIQCNISNTPSDIGNAIADTFSSFASGDIANGISKLINNGLKLLLGSYSGNSSMRDTYAIACGELGGISRLDMHFYSYRYTADQLTSIAKQVLCVSIVRSSVDPTKLSDATLRNIIQNTYSASSKDEQQKMYDQLKAARDADLQHARETSSVAFSAAVKALNNYTVPSMRAIAAPRKAHSDYKLYKQVFTASFEMNTAHAYKDALQAWINGALAISFGEAVDEIAVQVEVEPNSTSDSVLEGEASTLIVKTFPSPQQALNKHLQECLEKLVRTELSQVLARSYTIGQLGTLNGTDGTNGANGELNESDDDFSDGFSDVEEVVGSSRPKHVTKSRAPTVLVHANVLEFHGPEVPLSLMLGGLQLAEKLGNQYIRSRNGDHVYMWPRISLAENQGFWGAEGSHMHFVFQPAASGYFKALRAIMTVRHRTDIATAGANFHIAVKSSPDYDDSMTWQKWKDVIAWWCAQPPPVGDAWRNLNNDPFLKGAQFELWQTLLNDTLRVCNLWYGNSSWSY